MTVNVLQPDEIKGRDITGIFRDIYNIPKVKEGYHLCVSLRVSKQAYYNILFINPLSNKALGHTSHWNFYMPIKHYKVISVSTKSPGLLYSDKHERFNKERYTSFKDHSTPVGKSDVVK